MPDSIATTQEETQKLGFFQKLRQNISSFFTSLKFNLQEIFKKKPKSKTAPTTEELQKVADGLNEQIRSVNAGQDTANATANATNKQDDRPLWKKLLQPVASFFGKDLGGATGEVNTEGVKTPLDNHTVEFKLPCGNPAKDKDFKYTFTAGKYSYKLPTVTEIMQNCGGKDTHDEYKKHDPEFDAKFRAKALGELITVLQKEDKRINFTGNISINIQNINDMLKHKIFGDDTVNKIAGILFDQQNGTKANEGKKLLSNLSNFTNYKELRYELIKLAAQQYKNNNEDKAARAVFDLLKVQPDVNSSSERLGSQSPPAAACTPTTASARSHDSTAPAKKTQGQDPGQTTTTTPTPTSTPIVNGDPKTKKCET